MASLSKKKKTQLQMHQNSHPICHNNVSFIMTVKFKKNANITNQEKKKSYQNGCQKKRDWTSKEKNHIRPNILKILHEYDSKIISNSVQLKNRERLDNAANTEKKKVSYKCHVKMVRWKLCGPLALLPSQGSVGWTGDHVLYKAWMKFHHI